jgi:hypothetical protein
LFTIFKLKVVDDINQQQRGAGGVRHTAVQVVTLNWHDPLAPFLIGIRFKHVSADYTDFADSQTHSAVLVICEIREICG